MSVEVAVGAHRTTRQTEMIQQPSAPAVQPDLGWVGRSRGDPELAVRREQLEVDHRLRGQDILEPTEIERAVRRCCTFVLSNDMRPLPNSLNETARADGASMWTLFPKIVLPLTRPVLAALATLAFTWIYHDVL